MEINIIQENQSHHKAVFDLVEAAFKSMKYSSGTEQFLVEKLRKSDAFIPALSLVAIDGNKVVGHILLTKLKIKNDTEFFESLTLAPVSVLPAYQNKGIGSLLIEKAHKIAKSIGYQSVILIGHANYYPRFGYQKCVDFGIKVPFDSADENCMVKELVENGLKGVNGMVEYPKAFFE